MNNKVAIVTGGSSGLGYATAKQLIDDGMTVIITGRDRDKLQAAKESLGDQCIAKQVDTSDFDALPGFIEDVVSDHGGIDVLVNNAGINMKKAVVDVTNEDFQKILNVNLTGVFALCREVIKVMTTQETKGVIINISSMAAQYGLPYVIAYSASKTAIDGMTRALAVELGPVGIRVNAVAPGFIHTPMTAKALDSDPARKAKVMGRTPMGKMGEPQDIADAISFLVSDRAKYIHGVVLAVDGGNSIGF